VLYGGGQIGRNIYKHLEYDAIYQVVLWCDSNAMKIGNTIITTPDKIENCEFDVVLIAIANIGAVNEVREYLKKIGISDDKIITV
jgi:hypothetical protein